MSINDIKTSKMKPLHSTLIANTPFESFRFKSYIADENESTKIANRSHRNEKLASNLKSFKFGKINSESLLHSKSYKNSGKILKRKNEKQQIANVECYNLIEKEKFRQLIEQNCLQSSKMSNNSNSKNVYKNFIHSSPTSIRDDIDSRSIMNKTDMEKVHLPYSNFAIPSKVSVGYTRRISLSLDSKPSSLLKSANLQSQQNKYASNGILKNSLNSLNKYSSLSNSVFSSSYISNVSRTKDPKNIIEIDLSSSSNSICDTVTKVKTAQKRPNQQQLTDNEKTDKSNMENFRKETKDYYSHYTNGNSNSYSKLNRSLNEFEKNINERLNKNQHIIEAVLKKSNTKLDANLLIEEERYLLKKRQRLEKDKIEKELAFKFSQQLHLDSSKLSGIYLQEDLIDEEEDEFPELQEEHLNLIENALISSPADEVLVSAFSISITRRDVHTLKGLNWLNDEIINFYMSLICERSKQETAKSYLKTHAFTTFFYPKLIKDGYASLKRWTRKIDIFSYDLLIVPVHLGLHWTLAVIDFTNKEIRYYDSMNGNNGECLKSLKNYLLEEHKDKKGSPIDLSDWNCLHIKNLPQQMNGSDCGMFACKYAEYTSRGKTVFNFNQSHMPYFRRRMIWEILNTKLM